jgi:hypothetical protein
LHLFYLSFCDSLLILTATSLFREIESFVILKSSFLIPFASDSTAMAVEKQVRQDSQEGDVEEALLAKEELENEFLTFPLNVKATPSRKAFKHIRETATRHAFFIHVLFLTIYSGIFLLLLRGQLRNGSNTKPLIVSPATSAIRMESKVLQNSLNATNPYKGPPNEELDRAWHELLKNSNIRLSPEELKEMDRTSVQLADGSGDYVGSLGVFPSNSSYHHNCEYLP